MDNKNPKDVKRNLNEIRLLKKCQCKYVVSYLECYNMPAIEEAWVWAHVHLIELSLVICWIYTLCLLLQIIMEYMEGGSLANTLSKTTLTERQIAYIVKNVSIITPLMSRI
jgi:serine/threonine protein kinase